jgi:NTE family protein
MPRGSNTRLLWPCKAADHTAAFTWGVLDRLLEDPTISSAQRGPALGAINGTILIDGLACGGPTQARTGLRRYWEGLVGTMPGFGSLLSISGEAAAMTPLESVPPYVE